MTDAPHGRRASTELDLAVVLRPAAGTCRVIREATSFQVGYAKPFASRAAELVPGHLVAIATAPDGSRVVVWRWFDAVVLGSDGGQVRVWEPAHGEVLAQARRPDVALAPGSRAYASAGLPGADWWVAGPAAVAPGRADVEVDEVRLFYTMRELWDHLV